MSDDVQQSVDLTTGSALSQDNEAPGETRKACDPRARPMMGPERQADVLLRLAKAVGQVQGVSRMVNADRYCVDVLTQSKPASRQPQPGWSQPNSPRLHLTGSGPPPPHLII